MRNTRRGDKGDIYGNANDKYNNDGDNDGSYSDSDNDSDDRTACALT